MNAVLHHPVRAGLLVVAALLIGFVTYRWVGSAVHPVSAAAALDRFHSQSTAAGASAPFEPSPGVYMYTGAGTEHVSVPPKTLSDGPAMPGTLTRQADGCWTIRIDFSDAHWESSSFCRSGGGLMQTARQGWMKWDFVAVVVDDTSTYTCEPPETAVAADVTVGRSDPYSCRGANDHLNTGQVVMSGTTQVIGIDQLSVGGEAVDAVHVRETATFSGGQTGTHTSDLWYAPTGLPVRVNWSEVVHSPSPLGTATMTGSGQYHLTSMVPKT